MWTEFYGWNENPFSIKINTNLVGIEEEKRKLLEYVSSGDICFLTGASGVGKSSLLRWIEQSLKKYNIVYISAEDVDSTFKFSERLKIKKGFLQKAFKKYNKDTILLLDEFQAINNELITALKMHWDQDHIKSMVIAQVDENLTNFSDALKERIGGRIIKLKGLSKSDLYDLIQLRTNGKIPFEKETVELIAEKSNFIPRRVLENCERLCIEFAGKKEVINAFDAEQVLGNKVIEVKPKVLVEKTVKKEELSRRFSPMQYSIIRLLIEQERTAKDLALQLQTSEGSIGKQLSKLNKMNVVTIVDDKRPKIYGLSEEIREKF